jgi:hypothetical protein
MGLRENNLLSTQRTRRIESREGNEN